MEYYTIHRDSKVNEYMDNGTLPYTKSSDNFVLVSEDQIDLWTLCVDNIQYYGYSDLMRGYVDNRTYPFGIEYTRNNDERVAALLNTMYYDGEEQPKLLSHEEMYSLIMQVGEAYVVGGVMSGLFDSFIPALPVRLFDKSESNTMGSFFQKEYDDSNIIKVNNIRIFIEVMFNYILFKHSSGVVVRLMGISSLITKLFNYYDSAEKNDTVMAIISTIGAFDAFKILSSSIISDITEENKTYIKELYSSECIRKDQEKKIFKVNNGFETEKLSILNQIYNKQPVDNILDEIEKIDLSEYHDIQIYKLLESVDSNFHLSKNEKFNLIMKLALHIGENPSDYYDSPFENSTKHI